MTNIQAINLLKGLEQSLDDYCELNDEGKTAFRMAIAALELFGNAEQLPSAQPEPCEDTISRKEAIDAILAVTGNSSVRELYEHVQEHGLSDMWSGGVNAAIDIIIALPSAQPDSKELSFTQKKLDTISRQAAIRWVKTECNPYGKPTLDFESGKKVIEHLKQMPSVLPDMSEYSDKLWRNAYERGRAEAQRKKGKWIDDDGNAATDKYCATCSACGEWSEYLTAYCPNCGAEMLTEDKE